VQTAHDWVDTVQRVSGWSRRCVTDAFAHELWSDTKTLPIVIQFKFPMDPLPNASYAVGPWY